MKITTSLVDLKDGFGRKSGGEFPIALLLLFLASQLALAFGVSRGYLLVHNTLSNNGQWVSTKTQLDKGVMGAYSFLDGQQALARQALNLGAWHGFQEVFYKDTLNVEEVQFDFHLKSDAYLSFIFDRRQHGYSGIRLSANRQFPSIYFEAGDADGFTSKEGLNLPSLLADHRYRARLRFDTNTLSLFLDGQHVFDLSKRFSPHMVLGYRGSLRETYVDNIEIHQRVGDTIHESFRNRKGMWRVSAVSLFLVIVMNVGAFVAMRIVTAVRGRSLTFALVTVNLVLTAITGLLFVFQFVTARNYPTVNENMKNREAYWKEAGSAELARLIRDRYSAPRDDATYRILFIGSSQTWGAGAATPDQTFVRRVEDQLNASLFSGMRVECINGGISGQTSTQLLGIYKAEWMDLDPDAVVINLSSNDSDVVVFDSNVREILDLSRLNNIRSILMLEPNSTEVSNTFLLQKHDVMRQIGGEYDVPIIDIHSYLVERRDRGFLWWDFVHLTGFGQKLVATKLSEDLPRLLRSDVD